MFCESVNVSSILPEYPCLRQERVSSTFLRCKGASQPWLTINARSASTASSGSHTRPVYKEAGDTVAGEVILLLDKPDPIQAVKISLRGISSLTQPENARKVGPVRTLCNKYVFLESTQALWSLSEGVPLHAEAPPWGFPSDGRLQGKFIFPYSFQLPLELPLDSSLKDAPPTFPCPASLYDKEMPVAIDYELSVTLFRGALKQNTTLNLKFIYAPRTRPEPPSKLRQDAYKSGFLAADPFGDPLGWHPVTSSSMVKGKLANGRSVDVTCTLALAKPLTYGRGSFIPLNLSIQCEDLEALRLVQSPTAMSVILLQRIVVGRNAHSRKARTGRVVHVSPVAQAVCWPATNTRGRQEGSCMLMGEIALPKKLPPSIVSPRMILSYSIVMLPFEITGFKPTNPYTFLMDQLVVITTHPAEGPLPTSQIPQGYECLRNDTIDRFQQVLRAVNKF